MYAAHFLYAYTAKSDVALLKIDSAFINAIMIYKANLKTVSHIKDISYYDR